MAPHAQRQPGCIGSSHSDRQRGGLTTLVHEVAVATSDRVSWTWLARLDDGRGGAADIVRTCDEMRRAEATYEVRIVRPRTAAPSVLNALARARHYSRGGALVPPAYSRLLSASLDRQIPDGTAMIHWVGTGLELMGFALRAQAVRRGIPFTVCPALHPHEWGDGEIDGRLYRLADMVVALSEHERDRLIELGVRRERTVRSPLGPTVVSGGDGDRFRRAYGLDSQPVVAFIGRRSQSKGLDVLAEAVRRLRHTGTQVSLVVVGPAGDLPDNVLQDLDVVDLGVCDEPTKADLLDAADIVCVPSTQESFGIVYVDAWSVGVPVIGGRPPAVAELVEDGVDGFLVDQAPAAIVEKLKVLLDHPELRLAMGAAGREKQQRNYTWTRCATVHADAFAAAAASASSAKRTNQLQQR